MRIVGLKAALNSNNRYRYRSPEYPVDHLVIGGGVVGLAVARALILRYPEKTTYVVERNGAAGEETSSRNSEVIHAGLYYPSHSLKESLCIRGRHLLYQYCDASSVPYRKTGKLIVATESQRPYIESLYKRVSFLEWPAAPNDKAYPPQGPAIPTELISGAKARELEPDLSPEISAALWSHETGIVDSHTLMESLERDITESDNGDLAYSTSVVRVDPYDGAPSTGTPDAPLQGNGWVVQMVTHNPQNADPDEGDAFLARTIINASGLSGNLILNSLLPLEQRVPIYFARGSYAAYNGPGVSHVRRLLYPCPDTGRKGSHAFQSLGTHLTLDLNGNVKFGPDLQWISPGGVSPPTPGATPVPAGDTSVEENESYSYDEKDIDFWKQYLVPDESQIAAMSEAVKSYLSGVDESKFRQDYVGIRPKLVPPWGGFQDFVFRKDRSIDFLKCGTEARRGGEMITLLGIESPGLTASLAIAEKVITMLQ